MLPQNSIWIPQETSCKFCDFHVFPNSKKKKKKPTNVYFNPLYKEMS